MFGMNDRMSKWYATVFQTKDWCLGSPRSFESSSVSCYFARSFSTPPFFYITILSFLSLPHLPLSLSFLLHIIYGTYLFWNVSAYTMSQLLACRKTPFFSPRPHHQNIKFTFFWRQYFSNGLASLFNISYTSITLIMLCRTIPEILFESFSLCMLAVCARRR